MQPSLYLASPALERGVATNRELGIVKIKATLGCLSARITSLKCKVDESRTGEGGVMCLISSKFL